jgi:hypothetical protein
VALSNTYNFAPTLGEAGLYALSRCDVKKTAILQEHLFDLRMAANLVCMDFSNKGVNLWQVELITQALTQGQATYEVDPAVVVILDMYRTQNPGLEDQSDQIMLPISRSEYASYTNKNQQGVPSTYWNNRLLAPTFTTYLTPDGTWPQISYYAVKQLMDANLANGGSVDIPPVWFKAFVDALVAELSLTYAFEKFQVFKAVADASYLVAAEQNVEVASQYILPQIGSYFSR